SSRRWAWSRMPSPNSVILSWRVVRVSSRSPSAASSALMRRDTVDFGKPARSAAREKLPASMTCANRIRSSAVTAMRALRLFQKWVDFIRFDDFRRAWRRNTVPPHQRNLLQELAMKILQINASARSNGANSTRVADAITARLQALHPDATGPLRDLARDPHPVLDEPALKALFTPAEQRTTEQAARVALDDALIAQVQAADAIVIGVPMYNFGTPIQLKAWIDAIARAGVT